MPQSYHTRLPYIFCQLYFLSTTDKLFADADILKVTETKNGYEIKLSGDDSKNCDDYVWEYKT